MGIAVGFGIGYVLGTRAGREQYERICHFAAKVRRFPVVARPLDAAGEKVSSLVRTQGEKVTDKVADAVKERLFGTPSAKSAGQSQPVDAGEASLRPVNEAG